MTEVGNYQQSNHSKRNFLITTTAGAGVGAGIGYYAQKTLLGESEVAEEARDKVILTYQKSMEPLAEKSKPSFLEKMAKSFYEKQIEALKNKKISGSNVGLFAGISAIAAASSYLIVKGIKSVFFNKEG